MPVTFLVGMTGFEPATSCSQTLKSRFFAWFTRLFGAFESEIGAFGCSCKHCFHIVRSRRWSKVWSSSFRWDQNAVRKSRIRLRINSFSAVIIPYIIAIVKNLLSTRKICIAVVKEKNLRKVGFIFKKVLDFLFLLWYVVVLTEKEAKPMKNMIKELWHGNIIPQEDSKQIKRDERTTRIHGKASWGLGEKLFRWAKGNVWEVTQLLERVCESFGWGTIRICFQIWSSVIDRNIK